MTYTEWLAIVAMAISIFGIWYGQRQATAAESSARSAQEAEDRALKIERVMGFRWEIIPNGLDRYLVFNAGTRVAHNVKVDLPDFMSGVELKLEHLRPLERAEFVARIKPHVQSQIENPLPRLVTIRWEDRDEKRPVHRVHTTTVAEYLPA